MGSNTLTPLPVLNRNSSDDEILGLPTQPARRTGRHEEKSEARDSNAQDSATRATDQLTLDFADAAGPQVTRRSSATDGGDADANATGQVEPEHLRAALDANPELRDAWQDANAYRKTSATSEEARAATAERLVTDGNTMWARGHSFRGISDLHRPRGDCAGHRTRMGLRPAAHGRLPGVR
jgi:hypothetical protein